METETRTGLEDPNQTKFTISQYLNYFDELWNII